MKGFRMLKIVLGLMVIIQAVFLRDWIFAVAGIIFTAMPVFNVGCCTGTSCKIPEQKNINKAENIHP